MMKKNLIKMLSLGTAMTLLLCACGTGAAPVATQNAPGEQSQDAKAEENAEEKVEEEQEEVMSEEKNEDVKAEDSGVAEADDDQAKADEVAALIDAIYVQEYTPETDEMCAKAKAAWDALTEEQKQLVEGEYADYDYFGRDTGDASLDDPGNQDDIGEKEILVVSFGASFNESRAKDIGGIEKAVAEAFPDYSVRRAFTAQTIINHVLAREGEKIDNVDQALSRAVDNGVKELIILPTHLMQGAEYDELKGVVDEYQDQFETVKLALPLLGEVGDDATVINEDKEKVANIIADDAVAANGYDSVKASAEDGTAFVFVGHGTSHNAKVSYSQMQTQLDKLGYENIFIGTVEGEPEETSMESLIDRISEAGYKKVVIRPLMVVASDHVNNDIAGDDDDSWISTFKASGKFDSCEVQKEALGRSEKIEEIYVEHVKAVQ